MESGLVSNLVSATSSLYGLCKWVNLCKANFFLLCVGNSYPCTLGRTQGAKVYNSSVFSSSVNGNGLYSCFNSEISFLFFPLNLPEGMYICQRQRREGGSTPKWDMVLSQSFLFYLSILTDFGVCAHTSLVCFSSS